PFRTPIVSTPTDSSALGRRPSHGCHSAAGPAAASARPSRTRRWTWCCEPCCGTSPSTRPPIPARRGTVAASRTPRRRGGASCGRGASALRLRAGPPRQLPTRPDVVTRVAAGIALQVVLMLRLRLPEITGRGDFGDHLAGPQTGRLDVADGVQRDLLLLVVDVEDRRPIAGANVVALTVLCGRIVDLEEELQQRAKVRLVW